MTSQHREPPRSKNARKRQSQFLSAAKRTYASDTSIDTPGPAAYDGFLTARAHGYAPVYDARFRNETSNLPGPADYEVRKEKNPSLTNVFFRLVITTSARYRSSWNI